MIIENHEYKTDLTNVNDLRYILFTNVYTDINKIKKMTDIISKHIDCLSIEYNYFEYSFTLKIKKTSMRKLAGFNHNPLFYYDLGIPDIFQDLININKDCIINILKTKYEDPYTLLDSIISDKQFLINLCHISCISDNIIIIKL